MPHEIIAPASVMVGLIAASGFLLKAAYDWESSEFEKPPRRLQHTRWDWYLLNRDIALERKWREQKKNS